MKFLFCTLLLFIGTSVMAQDNEVPTWPGCEDTDSPKDCFNGHLADHINDNFEYPDDYDKEEDKGTKVTVNFKINKEGKPEIMDVDGGRDSLQEAAKENIKSIPKMKEPAKDDDGDPKGMELSVPFTF